MTEDHFCARCVNVGHVEVRPDQLGWLRRPELESATHHAYKIRLYEHGDGTLEAMPFPYKLRVRCIDCARRYAGQKGITIYKGE